MSPGKPHPGAGGSADGAKRKKPHDPLTSLDGATTEEHGRTLLERLRRISEHSPGRDRYTEIEEIGRGGMGRVLRVWDEDLQRELALKELAVGTGSSEIGDDHALRDRLLSRFISEARITSQLDHPGIVPVHEIAIDRRGTLYFTMPLVHGKTVQEIFNLARQGRRNWTLHRALEVLLRITHTVAYAHSKGVIHRDLKPSNVMVGRYHEVYVMDWGLATIRGTKERDAIVGTPAYMAPEQAVGDQSKVNARADVYSLGAMLYELLTGSMPHQETLAQGDVGIQDVALEAPRSVAELKEDLPAELVAICDKAMAYRQKDRYPTAMAFADDLQAWLERRVVGAYETGRWARIKKWRERNRGLSQALEALLLLGLLSVAIVFAVQRSKRTAIARERGDSEHNAYAARIKAAELSFEQGGWGEAQNFLNQCPPHLRGWAWRHLTFRADSSQSVLEHEDTVNQVAVRPDGTRIATASDDGTVSLWDTSDQTLVNKLEGHTKPVLAADFSPNGTLLATGSLDRTIRLWDASTGIFSRTLKPHDEQIQCLDFSPDGTRIVAGDIQGRLYIWNLDTGELEHKIGPSPGMQPASPGTWDAVEDVLWEEKDHFFAAFLRSSIFRIRAADGMITSEGRAPGTIYGLALREDRALLAMGSLDEVTFLDPQNLREESSIEFDRGIVRSVAFEPNGTNLLVGTSEGAVRVYSATGELTDTFHGHKSAVISLAYYPGRDMFVSGSTDRTARLWSTRTRQAAVRDLQIDSGAAAPRLQARTMTVAGSLGDQVIFQAHLDGNAPITRIQTNAECSAIALHPDGSTIAIAHTNGSIALRDRETGTVLQVLRGSDKETRLMQFSPTDDRLLSRGLDATIRMWDLETGETTLEIPDPFNGAWEAMAFAPDGKQICVGLVDGRVRVYDAQNGDLLDTLDDKRGKEISCLVYFPDGKRLISGAANGVVTLWNMSTQEPELVLEGHKQHVTAAVFSRDQVSGDQDRLVTSSLDRTVRIWDIEHGSALMTLRCDASATDVIHDPETDQIIAVDKTGRIYTWRTRADR